MTNRWRKEFGKIYDQYIDKIYRFIFLKVNSQEIAEDLTSETFLKGWEAYKNQKSKIKNQKEIENLQAFLYQIARNLVIDYYRKKGKTQIISADQVKIIDPKTNLEEKAAVNSEVENIKTALANLKEEYQNVIIWHYLDDLSISEIAKMLNKSEETARVMLHRALKILKNKLNQDV
ncbi:MAG: RNA polymerase sigma factor [Patescibacteria group bacterium]|nr:RNA polymerase sigma factor [Patescibacteria group bacterium]